MKRQFETESKRILDLMINSIYTNREIFLRELISNASDAIDKRYFELLRKNDSNFDRKDFKIQIEIDKENRTLSISDNGIGMDRDDLEKNLGTIAKSGSLDFKNENKDDEISIIGQFGVGFYSAFMVSNKIEVTTKKGEQSFRWVSEGLDGYEIFEDDKSEIGTLVKLYLKENTEDENYDEYLNEATIKYLVKKYSNYIKYPVKLESLSSRLKEGSEDEFEDYLENQTLNSMVPIWNKNKSEVTKEEYENFYLAQRYGFDNPLAWVHLSAEGVINYKSILYIPTLKPMQFYTSNYTGGLELYSNGVMIMEKNEDLLPDYLSFVKGIVDSEDLSLNISREILQNDRRLKGISKNLEKKVLSELKSILMNRREDYEKFFGEFGLSLKAGIYESQGAKKADIEDLLIYKSAKSGKYISLEEYASNFIEGQNEIYYATGENIELLKKSPLVKNLTDKDIDVILLDQNIDEFVIKILENYREFKFKSVFEESKDTNEEKTKAESSNQTELLNRIKNVLKDEIVEAKISSRLTEDASFLTSKGDISIEMEKTFALNDSMMPLKAQKVLELNENHKLYKMLMSALSENNDEKIKLISSVLYDQARLTAGLKVEDAVEFTRRINSLI